MPTCPWVAPATLRHPLARTVHLEPLSLRHAPDLLAAADPELFRQTMQCPDEWSVRGFEQELARVMALPGVVALAIVLEATGRAIGRTTYMDIRPEHRALEIGRTWIGRAWHGARVNPEIKYLMLVHAFESLTPAANRVQFTTSGSNVHSQAAIAKLGAVKEGVLRNSRIQPPIASLPGHEGGVRDTVVYSILAQEWSGGVKARLESRLTQMG